MWGRIRRWGGGEKQQLEKYGRSRRRRRRGILQHAALKVCHGLHRQRSCLVLTFLQIDEVLQVCNRPEGSRLPLPSTPSCPPPLLPSPFSPLPPAPFTPFPPFLYSLLPFLYSLPPFPLFSPVLPLLFLFTILLISLPSLHSLTSSLPALPLIPLSLPLLSCPSSTPFTLYPALPTLFPYSSSSLLIPHPFTYIYHHRRHLHLIFPLVSASPLLPIIISTPTPTTLSPTPTLFPSIKVFCILFCILL